MSLICSNTEPGHPCVMISDRAFAWGERTWMKWISTPSILVLNCGVFNFRSAFRQS
jgi:hypothetical protein